MIYRYFYAKGNTKDTAINGVIVSVANITISIVLAYFIGVYGIIIGTAVSSFISLIVILIKFKKRYGSDIGIVGLLVPTMKNIIISVLTIIAVILTKQTFTISSPLVAVIVYGFETVIVFLILALVLSKDNLRLMKNL